MSTEPVVSKPAGSSAPRSDLAMWLGAGVVLAVGLVGVVTAMGGRLEAATWGLVVASGAMLLALRSLYRMANVLARPAVEVALEQDDVAAHAGVRELREERRRLLRAINELQFDYEMGKLSDEDYRKVREGYELQAVEVIRALDAERTLHPGLREELERLGLLADEPAEPEASADAESSDEPEASADAESSEEPEASADAESSDEPEASADAESSDEPEASADAESSDEPEASADAESSEEPDTSLEPEQETKA